MLPLPSLHKSSKATNSSLFWNLSSFVLAPALATALVTVFRPALMPLVLWTVALSMAAVTNLSATAAVSLKHATAALHSVSQPHQDVLTTTSLVFAGVILIVLRAQPRPGEARGWSPPPPYH